MDRRTDKATESEAHTYALNAQQLKKKCDPTSPHLVIKDGDANEAPGPVGQKRAVEALQFGLDVRYKGYNIFVSGPPGSGKTSMTLQLIRERATHEPEPQDLCYIYNFDEPHRPIPLHLSTGKGDRFARRVHKTIAGLARSIFQVLNEEHFQARVEAISVQAEQQKSVLFDQLSGVAEKYNLRVEMDEEQLVVVPLENGEPIDSEVYDDLSSEEQDDIQVRAEKFQDESASLIHAQRALELEIEETLSALEREAIKDLVQDTFVRLKKSFSKEGKELRSYLDGMKAHVLEHYKELMRSGVDLSDEDSGPQLDDSEDLPIPYQVNVLVSHSKSKGAPIEVELEPTLAHIFGYLEYRDTEEGLSTDHMVLHAGALHRANGGYLILQAADLIRSPELWSRLKRALRHREIRFHDYSLDPDKPRIYGSMRPKSTPMNQKLVLIGSLESHYQLMVEDEDFDRIFKIKAQFESWMPRDEKHELEYARFLHHVGKEEGFLPISQGGLARMIEEGSREVESQDRISTSITTCLDLLCEADYWSRQEEKEIIEVSDIERALSFRDYRHDSIARNIIESIQKGELLIETDGWELGQVNGLLVYVSQDYSFGVPTKITARTYAGDKGIINIDREASLSGAIHDKGSMILVGLLGGMWGQDQPLRFNASITFEQLYGDVEGDSASCAAFYALLSSLSRTPIYQGIAVTGSINQQGLMQPIGSVNAKIEGMFTICKMRGLTGKQGVIIPIQNVPHLMLKDEVIEAVENGQFNIWAIRHVYEGIDILMHTEESVHEGLSQWNSKAESDLKERAIFKRVQKRIKNFHDVMQKEDGTM